MLLLDEPTAALDPRQRKRLWEIATGTRDRGGAVVFVTQNLEELERFADRVVVLRAGELVFEGTRAAYEATPGGGRLRMRRGLRSVRLLGKDLRVLGRSPGRRRGAHPLPAVVAVIVGLVVRYAGDRPRIALVDEDGLPAALEVGGQTFDVQQIFDRAAEDVELVTAHARGGRAAAGVRRGARHRRVSRRGFSATCAAWCVSRGVKLRTTESAIATRVVEKVQSLVYLVNLQLQRAYIEANLQYVNLLNDGGSGSFLGDDFDVMGLAEAGRRLDQLAQNPDPDVRAEAEELANFVRQARLALAVDGRVAAGHRQPDRARARRERRPRADPLRRRAGLRAGAHARLHRRCSSRRRPLPASATRTSSGG